MKNFLLILLSILFFNHVDAQALIGGTVKDAITKEPIPYVSVILSTTFKGTSTDASGEFVLEIPDYSDQNVFTFQLVGYKTIDVNLVELMRSDVIYLEVQEQKIKEVVVSPLNPHLLVQEAIDKIADNYYSKPIGQEVFYRQTLVSNDVMSLIEEGHFDIINPFHRTRMPKNITVKKARAYADLSVYQNLGKMVAKNLEEDSLYIKNSAQVILGFNPNIEYLTQDKTGFLGENREKFYEFKYAGIAIKNNRVLHIIQFDQKENLKKTLYQGTLYIDTTSKAVVEINSHLSPEGVEYQKLLPLRFRLLAKLGGYKIQVNDISFSAKYTPYNGYWVINEGDFTLNGSIAKRKNTPILGELNYAFKVLNNFDKKEFFNKKTPYDVISSDKTPFNDKYFWGELNTPYLKEKEGVLLDELLKD